MLGEGVDQIVLSFLGSDLTSVMFSLPLFLSSARFAIMKAEASLVLCYYATMNNETMLTSSRRD